MTTAKIRGNGYTITKQTDQIDVGTGHFVPGATSYTATVHTPNGTVTGWLTPDQFQELEHADDAATRARLVAIFTLHDEQAIERVTYR